MHPIRVLSVGLPSLCYLTFCACNTSVETSNALTSTHDAQTYDTEPTQDVSSTISDTFISDLVPLDDTPATVDAVTDDTGLPRTPDTGPADTIMPGDGAPAPSSDTVEPDNDASAPIDIEELDSSEQPIMDTQVPNDSTLPEVTPPFGQIVSVSEGTGYDSGELLGMTVDDEGRVRVFWRGNTQTGAVDLLVSASDELVSSFNTPMLLKGGLAPQAISAGGDMEYLENTYLYAWRDSNDAGAHVIYFRKGAPADLNGTDQIIVNAGANTALWRPYIVAKDAQTSCIIWEQKDGALYDIMSRCTQDSGATWGEVLQVDTPSTISATLSTAAFTTSGQLVIALQRKGPGSEQHIAVQRSNDLGATWVPASDVGGTTISGGGISEAVLTGANVAPSMLRTMTGNLKLAWHRPLVGASAEAYLTTSSDGLFWTTPSLVPQASANVELVVGRGSDLHLSTAASILGQGDTHYMSSADEGLSWNTPTAIPKTAGSTLLDHKMRGNLVSGWLHVAWWETLPGTLLEQRLQLVTVDPI